MVRFIRAVLALCVFGFATAASAQPAGDQACQRACLEGWVDKYLVAMRDGTVDPALFAREVTFTENGVRLPLGKEGLWYGMTGIGTYKFYVPDVETQQVAFIGTVLEQAGSSATGPAKDTLVAIALRLRIRDGKITEVEQLAIRPASTNSSSNMFPPTGEGVEAMKAPAPVFREAIPESKRATREELVRTANYYFAGLQRNDGKGYYPFTDDCIRFENGVDVLANALDPATGKRGRMTCKYQFEAALKGVVSRIRDRRFVAVDRERGIVFSFAFFDHYNINWTWQLGELFKIEDGKIRRIEAVFLRGPFGINSGWSTYEQGMSEEIQDIR
ncbi:MAG: hypothetical protein BGP16_14780 [Sphingobium sp. 66-54]|nr:MAG: hypothetical protein BGP16_14780 [Sphingobium sp. 66-54]